MSFLALSVNKKFQSNLNFGSETDQTVCLRDIYKILVYNKSLEDSIISDTSGHLKRILISLLQANRDESRTFDREQAKKDAEEILAAGEKKKGTDESKFIEILMTKSYPHLRAVFEEYEKMGKNTIEEALKKEMSGDVLRAFLTVVRCIQNKPAYFAKTLNRSMKGLGTDDHSLLRVILTRCEVDMVQIKQAYLAEYGKSLGGWIKDDTSGDFRRILLVLISEQELLNK